jgi:transcriptional regulator with XRE-family HTH domain
MSESRYADRLRLRRAAAGLTQRELAEASGVKQPLIAAIERGTRQPTETVRHALDGVLRVRPSQLLKVARDRVLAARTSACSALWRAAMTTPTPTSTSW